MDVAATRNKVSIPAGTGTTVVQYIVSHYSDWAIPAPKVTKVVK
jgi:hypothetical protein